MNLINRDDIHITVQYGRECGKQWNMERKVQDMVKKRVEEVCKMVVEENEADLADKAMRILSGERREK